MTLKSCFFNNYYLQKEGLKIMNYKEYMKKNHNINILGDEYQNKSEKIKQYYKQQFLEYKERESK